MGYYNKQKILREGFQKLDGIGPVDNRPSTDKLSQFVHKKKKKKRHVTCDT